MNIQFQESNPREILRALESALRQESLQNMVSFSLSDLELKVTISKLGKSHLFFSVDKQAEKTIFSFTKEKIALTHRALKGEVKKDIQQIVESAGGKII